MLMTGRSGASGEYRYAFNGMEMDDEVKGKGNSYTTYFRQLDPRIGRWLSVDPVTHSQYSPYISFDNNPIKISDPSGADGEDEIVEDGEEPTEKDISSIAKIASKISKKSNKLSTRERNKAERFAQKSGGEVTPWKDSEGNDRYSVKSPNEENTHITMKVFNKNKWSKLNQQSKILANITMSFVSHSGGKTLGVPDLIGVTSGVSYVGSNGFVHTDFTSNFYITAGSDKGWHEMRTTSDEKIGLTYEASTGLIMGQYMGNASNMNVNSLNGWGYEIGEDLVQGVNAWWTTNGSGSMTWLGTSITIGPSIGLSWGNTETEVIY